MSSRVEALKSELERFGATNDQATSERSRRMLNITRDTGEFLSVLVRATGARRVLEIGTSNGYSTLWLAEAAKAVGGGVTTVEFSEYKVGLASTTFARSGLVRSYRLCRTMRAGCSNGLKRAPSTLSSSTPSAPSIPVGGPDYAAFCALAGC